MFNDSYTNSLYIYKIRKQEIHTVFELGSCHGLDAINILKTYSPDKIYSFECNPESIPVCRNNLAPYPAIELIEKGVLDVDGKRTFFSTDMKKSKDKNIGASSFLWHKDNKKGYKQKKVKVEVTRLDTFMKSRGIPSVDLICMDLQGVEIKAMQGLGKYIRTVKYIITEMLYRSYYVGDENHAYNLRDFLTSFGFIGLTPAFKEDFNNELFIRKDLF